MHELKPSLVCKNFNQFFLGYRINCCPCPRTRALAWRTSAPALRSRGTTATRRSGAAPGTPMTPTSSSPEQRGKMKSRMFLYWGQVDCYNKDCSLGVFRFQTVMRKVIGIKNRLFSCVVIIWSAVVVLDKCSNDDFSKLQYQCKDRIISNTCR